MRVTLVLLLILLPVLPVQAADTALCADTPETRQFWTSVWQQPEARTPEADVLARRLLPCLDNPNPLLRDEYGYGLYTFWLRGEHLSDGARQALYSDLLADLQRDGIEDSLRRSFAALVLSELLRADNLSPFLDAAQRDVLLAATTEALTRETDYRGLDPQLGWVHPVAHLADLLWRFALHDALEPVQVPAILAAVRDKAVQSATAYRFNEPDRLARVVAVLLRREAAPAGIYRQWLEQFSTPASASDWRGTFGSVAGMTELHNSKLFLRALDDQLGEAVLEPGIRQTLDELIALFTGLV